MKKELIHITPLRAGIIVGLLYGILGLIFCPLFFLFMLFAPTNTGRAGLALGVMAILMPIGYAIMGFVFGVIGAFAYNVLAKLVGGLEFEVREHPQAPPSPQPWQYAPPV